MEKNGIDVSYAQGNIDWKKVKAAGIDFALIRVGWCYNNGTLKEDTCFQANMSGAIAAGIDVGVYLYSYALNAQAAQKAAQEVLAAIKPYKLTYPVVFDIEYEDIYTGGTKENNTAISVAFLDEIEKAGYYAMLYCSKDFLDSHLLPDKLTAYDKWIAQYASACTCKHPYGIWQYTSTGRVNGISTNVDRNIAYKDYASIIKGMSSSEAAPQQPQSLPYTVQVGAFADRVSADGLKDKLSGMGYFVFTVGDNSINIVCVGKFADKGTAQLTADDLKKKGYSGFVTMM